VDAVVALAPEADEVVVLGHHLAPGAGEVEVEGGHLPAEVVDVEDHPLRQVGRLAPHRPAAAERREAGLVPGRVDRLHAGNAEVPLQLGHGERREQGAAGAVHVEGDVEAPFGLQPVERGGDGGDVLEEAGEGLPERGHHHDRVLVAALQALLGLHQVAPGVHRDLADLHVEVARELLPADLHGAAHEVRPLGQLGAGGGGGGGGGVRVCAPLRAALAPAELRREARQHRGLAGAGGGGPERGVGVGGVPKVGQHPHAARLELGGLGVLVLVDDVLVEGLRQQLQHLGLHPGGAEGREVHARDPVEQQLVVHQRVGQPRVGLVHGEAALGRPPAGHQGLVGVLLLGVRGGVGVLAHR
jgi:hypothetical protein